MLNIEKEREAFLYELDGHGYSFQDMSFIDTKFNDDVLNMVWEMWLAAKDDEEKKLEGCVVAPVEPTEAMLFAASGRDIVAEHYGDENIMWPELRETWKAMVEAARGGNEH